MPIERRGVLACAAVAEMALSNSPALKSCPSTWPARARWARIFAGIVAEAIAPKSGLRAWGYNEAGSLSGGTAGGPPQPELSARQVPFHIRVREYPKARNGLGACLQREHAPGLMRVDRSLRPGDHG
jgi:hypothetical protein